MKTYVINLERSADRREYQKGQLARLGLEHEFIKTVDGRTLSPGDYASGLPANIAGGVLSHREAYLAILRDGAEAGFVLEDDGVLPDNTIDLLESIVPELDRAEVVMLHYRRYRRVDTCPLTERGAAQLPDGSRLLYPVNPMLSGATAYVITREACERMIEYVVPPRFWPDDWKAFVRGGALERVRCVYPRAAEVETDFKSTMEYAPGLLPKLIPARLKAWRRAMVERSLSRFPIVSDPPVLPDVEWPPVGTT